MEKPFEETLFFEFDRLEFEKSVTIIKHSDKGYIVFRRRYSSNLGSDVMQDTINRYTTTVPAILSSTFDVKTLVETESSMI